jgi:iron-sulfur cluster assembly protein
MTVGNKREELKVRIGNENLIRITKSADEKLINLIEREQSGTMLRIKIVGGGCNGLSYKMNFHR